MHGLNLTDYDFDLPNQLIAQRPLEKRDSSRLLIYDTSNDKIYHRNFIDIKEYFGENDLLILNKSRVLNSKIILESIKKKFDIVLVDEIEMIGEKIIFSCLAKKLKKDLFLYFDGTKIARCLGTQNNLFLLEFYFSREDFYAFLDKYGQMPLPPYIKRQPDDFDKNRYQTVYSQEGGSIAAPTAGLHFTNEILNTIEKRNTLIKYLSLHVGIGTFKPIKSENIKDHVMLPEKYEIDKNLSDILRKNKRVITSVGTTTTRTLESFFSTYKLKDSTNMYINIGHNFHIDRLLTNFHVPRSTPLILLVAFLAYKLKKEDSTKNPIDVFQKIYGNAIKNGYRFYSYGDSMFVV